MAALVAGAAVAFAAIPSSDGTIEACYYTGAAGERQPRPGSLRVVENSSSCMGDETRLTFNQQGRPGEQGPGGAEGPAGRDATIRGTNIVPTGKLKMYLTIPGIEGESADREGAIDVRSYSFASAAAGGQDLTFSKIAGAADPALVMAAMSGNVFPKATFDIVRKGKNPLKQHFELKNAVVTSATTGGTSNELVVTEYTLHFQQVKLRITGRGVRLLGSF